MNAAAPRVLGFTGAALAVALFASACASSSTSSGGGPTNAAGGNAAAPSGKAAAVMIESHHGAMGTFLTDSTGKALYMFAVDTATKSHCAGACLTYWPPLTTSGTAKVSGAASSGKITTIPAGNGSKQVVYAGHPLYYYKGDSAPGDTHGQGLNDFGGLWWLLTPAGRPITSSSGSSSSGSSGGGGW
jgi:predicted lipoprotein with Yx(FWY)xxD motif